MYTKHEIKKTRQDFWTTFGQYMKPVPNADGSKINWKNYKTGVKHMYFRMKAERDFASISIEVQHPDEEIRGLLFDQLITFKRIFQQEVGEEWEWTSDSPNEWGELSSKVEKTITGVNVMRKDDWPKIISFLKPRIVAIDAFWANMKYGFEGLV
ncbi:DUF4268 domain-containing protein [Cyclobacterium amurskyense]|uniref:DUF4268 domain-containing protein n=1 Tax=Cyclobacterium amurskyense TaxID=320787 RepID=A0A0H4PUJ2_9BACT|nr:DUF4268 domain-containing protein [Cyclobacterium amurskyense]AKP51987.1 hypothetical protein CA2015_2576 [Cyclobacterium amurskyense]|tara:strand:+ start:9439 stop:9900 length:462 start_codon:yes stop_codon:yes gene_type:complete